MSTGWIAVLPAVALEDELAAVLAIFRAATAARAEEVVAVPAP